MRAEKTNPRSSNRPDKRKAKKVTGKLYAAKKRKQAAAATEDAIVET